MIAALLTNRAYGYPTRGAARRRKPTVLAVLHQTANARTDIPGASCGRGSRPPAATPGWSGS